MVRGNGVKYFPVDNDEMDSLIIDIDGLDPPATTSSHIPPAATATFSRGSTFEQNYTTLSSQASVAEPAPSTSRARTPTRQNSETEFERQFSSHNTYYSNPEQEENIKCVVSSLLFVGIVFLVLFIIFMYNPQMA